MVSMIFLNTAWIERYEGLIGNDSEIHGGGSYVEEYGYGHEIFNFKNIGSKVYGYAQAGGSNNLQRLEAVYKRTKLRIEVKGLSGEKVSVEITPNEFKNMNIYKDNYRLCVVTNCLVSPVVHVFSYCSEIGTWLNEDGDELIIDQVISARCYI